MGSIREINRTIPFIAVSVAAVLAVGLSALYSVPPSGGTATRVSSAGCTANVNPTGTPNSPDVYQISTGSDSVICVGYQFDHAGNTSLAPNFGPISGSKGVFFMSCGSSNGTLYVSCTGLTITPFPKSVIHTAGENVTVAYVISPSSMTKQGLYWFFIGQCDPIILAVGPLPLHVPDRSGQFVSCISSLDASYSEHVTGVSNVNMATVPVA